MKGKRAIVGFICLIGVMLILVGLRISGESPRLGGIRVPAGAVFEVGEFGERIDFKGNISDAEGILRQLGAAEVRREIFCTCQIHCAQCSIVDGCLIVIYAFSDRLIGRTYERWGTFNIMIAVRNNNVAVGYPILNGSF